MMEFLQNNIANILSLFGILFTTYVGWRLGVIKDASERRASEFSAEEALRDDLILLVEKKDQLIEKKDKIIEEKDKTIELVKLNHDKLQQEYTKTLIEVLMKDHYAKNLEAEIVLLKSKLQKEEEKNESK